MLTIKTDLGDIPGGIEQMLGQDLPFTIARFLTMQAQSGQAAAREGERKVFKLRNDWTTQNTKITPAKKETQVAEVYTDTENRKTGATDYLPRQDDGGEKVPLAGHRFLAIPTRYLRRVARGVIPAAFRPRNLLPPNAKIGESYNGNFRSVGRSVTRQPRTKSQAGLLADRDFVAFTQHTKGGTLCIFVRHGGMGTTTGPRDAEPWYTLIPEAHITGRFPMEKLVQEAVDRDMEKNFDRAAAEVLVNNALKSGLRVKF